MTFFRIVNATKKKARLDIYDSIGQFTDWWTGDKVGLAARDFSAALSALDVTEIDLHINSPGGSVPDGLQIYNELRRHPAKVTVTIDGQAASIASIIAMAGDDVVMPENSTLWIHDPAAWVDLSGYQQADTLRIAAQKALNLADDLDTTRDLLANVYLARAGERLDRADLLAMMARETTITAAQAVEWGLADRIEAPLKLAACHDMAAIHAQVLAQAPATDPTPEPEPDPDTEPLASTLEFREATEYLALPIDIKTDDIPTVVNAALVQLGHAPHDIAPKTPAMDARAMVADCQTAGFPALAADLIASAATAPQVTARLALARDLKNRLSGAQASDLFQPLLDAHLKDPVHALCVALSYALEAGEPVIRNDHNGQTAPAARPLNVLDIQAARKAQR